MKWIVFVSAMLVGSFSYSQPLRVVTEQLPPLHFVEKDGSISGAMVDVVNLLLSKANLDSNIELLPWARSYQISLSRKNTLIFSMLRGKSREDKFVWIGKIFAIDSYLVALKESNITDVNSIDDAKKYSVGAVRQDLIEDYLRDNDFTENENLYLSSDYKLLWQLLYNGRTDLASTNSVLWRYELEDSKLDPDKVELIYKVPDIASDLYLAASIGTDEEIINKLKEALAEIKSSGQYQQILNKWTLNSARQ